MLTSEAPNYLSKKKTTQAIMLAHVAIKGICLSN
jgi:hypothetical protein